MHAGIKRGNEKIRLVTAERDRSKRVRAVEQGYRARRLRAERWIHVGCEGHVHSVRWEIVEGRKDHLRNNRLRENRVAA